MAGLLQLAAWGWIRHLGDLSQHVEQLWWCLLPILVGYGLGAWALRLGQIPRAAWIIGGVAIVARLLLLDSTPSLSDDIYRYLWDGRVQEAGLNPYGQAPAAEGLSPMHDDDWAKINHPELVTVYPPVAQWFFHLVRRLAPGVTGMKTALVLCDLLLILVLWDWLGARGQDRRRVLVYAWHPLPVLEIAGNGHVDVLGILCLCIALLWLHGGRRHAAALALTAAVLSKMIPLLCMGAFWRQLATTGSASTSKWKRCWSSLNPRPRLTLLWVPVLVFFAYLPFVQAGATMWTGLSAYASKWRFNDSAYGLIYKLLSDPKPGWQWDDEALLAARWVGLGMVALIIAWSAVRSRDPAAACAAVFGAQLLLAPTVHPWYVLWVLPFLVLRSCPAWMTFSWSVLLAYDVLGAYRSSGLWQESTSIRLLEYGPVYLLLLLPLWRRLHGGSRNGARVPTSTT